MFWKTPEAGNTGISIEGSIPGRGKQFFSSLQSPGQYRNPSSPIHSIPGVLFERCEDNYLPQFTSDIKNVWSSTSTTKCLHFYQLQKFIFHVEHSEIKEVYIHSCLEG
jgi:hypothetical protein